MLFFFYEKKKKKVGSDLCWRLLSERDYSNILPIERFYYVS